MYSQSKRPPFEEDDEWETLGESLPRSPMDTQRLHQRQPPLSPSPSDPSYNNPLLNIPHNRFPPGIINRSFPDQADDTGRHNFYSSTPSQRIPGSPIFNSVDEDQEPADVLVWNTPPTPSQGQHGPLNLFSRRHSDTEDASRPSLRKSRSIRSLGGTYNKTQDEDNIMTISSSNGNFLTEEYENHMVAVTKQLEQIKTTQDSILSELSDDMSNLQFDNVQLKNTNEHLTMQNSHLLQVITDLSNEVEHMRGVFRVRGWPLKEIGPDVTKEKVMTPPLSLPVAEEKVPEPETGVKSSENPPRRRHRSRSRSRTKELSQGQGQSQDNGPAVTAAKFETISLSDKHQPGPGDDQVAAMSMSPNVGGRASNGNKRKYKSKTSKLAPISSDSIGERGGGSTTSSNSKQNVTRRMPSISSQVKEPSSGGCFKGLFKRRNKKKPSTSSSDQFAR